LAAVIAYWLLAYALDREEASKLLTLLIVIAAGVISLSACCRPPARGQPGKAFGAEARKDRWPGSIGIMLLFPIVIWEAFVDSAIIWNANPGPDLWRGPGRGFLGLAGSPIGQVTALGLTGLVALTYFWQGRGASRWRWGAAVLLSLYQSAWIILVPPRPVIDVLTVQEGGASRLLSGANPYEGDYRNPYGDAVFLPPQVLSGPFINTFPYPPLSLFLSVPGHLLGDVRWSSLAALVLAACFMVAMGRALGLPPGHRAELGAIALLCHPRWFMILQNGWTEPFLVLFAAMVAWAIAFHRGWVAGLALGCLAGVKQYGPLMLPIWVRGGRIRSRYLLSALAVMACLTLVFVFWQPAAFWRGVVSWHFHSPFRRDSLTLSAWLAWKTGYEMPSWVGLALALLVGAIVWRWGKQCLSSAALGNTAIALAFMLFNKAGHINYFWWTSTMLPIAIIAAAASVESAKLDVLSRLPPAGVSGVRGN
jgi:hypothetical protein